MDRMTQISQLAQPSPGKIVLLVMDGLGGLPHPETGKTELETARTPNLDKLAADTIRQTLKAPELNQLILTFGLGISMTQIANLLFTSQTRKLSFDYVSASIDIGELSFGVYNFVFLGAALLMVVGLRWYLTRTTAGKAAVAVGQNPRGAAIVGIDVDRTYGFVFAMATALVGMMGAMLITRSAVFPTVGSPYTMKSFCLVAMAGIGNIPGILGASILLGVSENLLKAFRGLRGWADIVFFVLIITVILGRSIRGKKA